MENKPKKSRALIITIILVLLVILAGYLIFKNKDSFGVKTSDSISRIFSPLFSSINSKKLKKIDENSIRTLVQAGEDIKEGDNVSIFGSGTIYNNPPIVVKSGNNDDIYGFANQDIASGDIGEVILNSGTSNNFWDSFSDFLNNLFSPTNPKDSCTNGADNFPTCTTIDGECQNGANNPPLCTTFGVECQNGADNFPTCTTIGGECINGATNPPMCTNNGNECVNGADNFPTCTTIGGECINGATNPPMCSSDGLPDLIAGAVAPINTIVNTPTTLSSIITNNGGSKTEYSFSSFFSIKNDKTENVEEISVVIPILEAKTGNVATISYNFDSIGTYTIRACADKSSIGDTGVIPESNEDNNCGPWITLTATSSLPTPDDLPQCSDEIDNDNDGYIDALDPNCHIGGNIYEAYVPEHNSEANSPVDPAEVFVCSDGIDNDNDGYIDALDPNCHIGGNIYEAYVPEHNSEANSPVATGPEAEENKCRIIEENPLAFSDVEKAKLAELLRKFYLIAPTLKTEDDIRMIYKEIDIYKSLIVNLDDLTEQCYAQSADKQGNRSTYYENGEWITYTGPITRYGNPWYEYDTRDENTTYYTKTNNGVCGNGAINFPICTININGECLNGGVLPFCGEQSYCTGTPRHPNRNIRCGARMTKEMCEHNNDGYQSGCTWVEGLNLYEYEKILNIW